MCTLVKAQQSNITGSIKDTTSGNSVKNAVVALLNFKDSTIVNFTRVKENGSYSLDKISEGKYIFMVMHPSFADYVEDVDVKGTDIKMPPVSVTPKSKLLEAVIIKSGGTMRIKGDTTIYTADSFKVSANANVEELLKKMPGIQVDKNGQIKAMGETVEKVLVDGEEFFGDDPGMAVKNLRADAIKEVQVFKKKSDQAEFTGIDDGQSKQTINLKLKEDKKKGYFGKIDAAGGPLKNEDPRYNSNLMFSSFKGKRKLSAFLLNGNTGQDGLSWQDMEKFGGMGEMNMEMTDGGDIMMWSSGGNADEEPYINTQNGFITNVNAGIQYSNKFNNNLHSLNLSPKYNSQLYNNNKSNFTRSDIAGSVLSTNRNTVSDVNRNNIKLSGTYDMKLDSAGNNTLKITVGTNIYNTESNEAQNSITTGNSPSDIKNRANSITDKEIDKQAYNISALYKHKFKKNKRTLSFNASAYQLNTNANSYLDRTSETFTQGISDGVLLTEQLAESDKKTKTLSGKVIYTEPLSKKFALEIGHQLTINGGKNKQQTYALDAFSGKYDIEVDSLSNNFDQNIVVNQPSLKISYGGKKLKYSFGAGVGFTNFDLKDISENNHYKRNYTNFFPSANLTYNYKSNNNVRFNYSGRTTQPSLNQLQPLRNNNDQFNIYLGNPDLKPSFNHSFNIGYNSYNFIKDMWKYIGIWSNLTQNSITNSRVIDTAKGISTYQPVNTNGNFSMGLWGGMGFKLKKPGIQIGVNPNLNLNRFADIINGQKSFSKTTNAGLEFSINKSKDKKYEIDFSNNYSYNFNSNAQRSGTRKYSTNNVRINGKIYYKKVWSLSTDFGYYYWQNPDGGENINNNIWNARAERTFKNNEFTIYLQARDLLNENIGISRNFYGNSYSEEINDRLKRYFMVGFRWDFKNKAPKAKETPAVAEEIK
ncbi:MAG TPA: outer membrane beta-barrel family protein [Ferruginibacter sp.]|nr:outer membrane beta-barrel family protein [Ferruginibacter sp.]HRE62818.1 outer membrane beta-barrel family protein [Ferruginibacter sp.]